MLKYKLFIRFAVLVLVLGVLSAALGIWMIRQRVVQEAQTRVRYDLSSAWAVYQGQLRALETVVRLTAVRGPVQEACAAGQWNNRDEWREVEGLLAKTRVEFDLDFITIVSPDGQAVARGNQPGHVGDFRTSSALVNKALAGASLAGSELLTAHELAREGEGLDQRAHLVLQETPRAGPVTRQAETRGLAMVAAAPVERNGKVIGAMYAGVLVNRNQALVDRIQNIVFGDEQYESMPVGTVTVFLADARVATTVRLDNGNRAIGTIVSKEVADRVLDNGASWVDRAFVVKDYYLTAYEPIKDVSNAIIGMLYVGTLERPFSDLSAGMITKYSWLVLGTLVVAMVLAMVLAGRLAAPLHKLSGAADKMRKGMGFEPVHCDARSCCSETGRLIHAFNDMAEALVQRERELKDANEQLEGANKSLKATNASYMETLQFVSHELNSPISSIGNYAYMLGQKLLGPLTDKQASAIEVMNVNLRRLLEMIRHYLNLARIESGEMAPLAARVVVREEVIAPILASLGAELAAKEQRVEDLVPPKTMLHADLNQTREVFENLLSNAVKYGRQGGTITLSCQARGKWAEFRVRNEGDGISPQRMGELFRKFSRLEVGAPRGAHRGTGLGLFICRKIVEAHGGIIDVDSREGQWTEFRFTMPLEPSGGAGAQ
jgi:two-component system NtrC family sensor kinase